MVRVRVSTGFLFRQGKDRAPRGRQGLVAADRAPLTLLGSLTGYALDQGPEGSWRCLGLAPKSWTARVGEPACWCCCERKPTPKCPGWPDGERVLLERQIQIFDFETNAIGALGAFRSGREGCKPFHVLWS